MELIIIGKIINTHGLNGTLKVKSFTDFKEQRYSKGTLLYIAFERNYIPVTVKSHKESKTIDLVTFDEFDNINQVDKFKGCDIGINKELIHKLDEDEFYYKQIIGLDVYDDKELIGKCIDIRDYPQGEVIVVKTNGKDKLIPFRKEFIKEVNLKDNKLIIIMWEGLI